MDFTQYQTASLIWDTYFGGSDADQVRGMFLNAQGNMVLTGYTLSPNFPVTADAAQSQAGRQWRRYRFGRQCQRARGRF